jgi:predicted nucleotidyltransferase
LAGELLLVSLETIKRQLCELKPVLKAKYNVETMEIFGSYARSEQTQKSDLDLLITFSKPYNIWEFIDVKEFLTKKLHVKVDLVPKDSIKPMLKDQILQEATPI